MAPEYQWEQKFDDRQKKEIALSKIYAADFAHGTDGHNAKMIIAAMARLLNEQEDTIYELRAQIEKA